MEIEGKNEVSFEKTEELRKILQKQLIEANPDSLHPINLDEHEGWIFDKLLQSYINRDRKEVYEYIISTSLLSRPTAIYKDLTTKKFSSRTFDKNVIYCREARYGDQVLYTIFQHWHDNKIGLSEVSFNSGKDELSSYNNIYAIQPNYSYPLDAIDFNLCAFSRYTDDKSYKEIVSLHKILYFVTESIKKYLEDHPDAYYVL